MHTKKEENVVFVLQKAIKHFKIKVTYTTVREFLLAHPYYPSLKSVCDALNKWKVENYPLNLELEEIKTLEMPFIAHLKSGGGHLVFIKEIKNGKVSYYLSGNNIICEVFDTFSERLSGAVVVMEGNKDSGEKAFQKNKQVEILNKSLLPLGIFTLIAWGGFALVSNSGKSLILSGYLFWELLLTMILGLAASVFLVLHELKISTPVADKVCGFSSKTDCDTVLSSNASRVFGWVNWADAGIIYFTGTLIYLLGINDGSSLGVVALISLLALPYPVFSIYYQAFKAKKWCPFCLTVQLVLVAEFVLLFSSLKEDSFAMLDIMHLIISLLLPATIWLFFKANYNKTAEFKKDHVSFLSLKRNPEIFNFLLQKNGYVEIQENKNNIILGNSDAPVTITAFLSLYCNPCANAFKKLKVLLDICPQVKINAIFSIYKDEEYYKLINYLYFLYNRISPEVATEFLYQWYSTDKKIRKSLYQKKLLEDFNMVEEIVETNKKLFDEHKVAGTPTVYIQGYKFPAKFDYSIIEFYIEDIKQLKRENDLQGQLKRQEACTNCKK